MEGVQDQCSGGCIGSLNWKYDWRSAVQEDWNSAGEGILESCGGRSGAMNWREDRSTVMEGALEKCIGVRTGAVQWREHWNSAME